jgi:hypothetical protein
MPKVAAPTSGKVQEVARLAPSIPAPSTVRPSSPRTGMLAIVAAPPNPAPVVSQHKHKKKRRSSSNGLAGKVLALLLLMALAAGGAFVYQRLRPAGPAHPAEWDPQVVPMVRFLEHERGLTFAHPVFVDLLSERDYTTRVTQAHAPIDNVDSHSLDQRDLANAFGFATTYDSAAADAALSADTSSGTYSATTDRIMLRGTELTPALKVTLVHELTHALQEQHFPLHLGGPHDLAMRSVAEADASRMASAYLASLTPDDQAAVATANSSLDAAAATALAAVPSPVVDLRLAPARLGPRLVTTAAAAGGNTAVDELFRHLPTDTQLISPWRRPTTADAPPTVRAPQGSTLVQAPTTLSVLQAIVMLDAWLPWRTARGAVDHWAEGSYVVYRKEIDSRLCVDAAVTFDASPTPFSDALAYWAALAGSSGTPTTQGRTVLFTACDRGPTAANPPAPVLTTSAELQLELSAMASSVGGDPAATDAALCVERTLIDNPLAAPILALAAPTPDQQAVVEFSRAAARQTCGA